MHPDNFQGVRTPSVGDLVIFHDSRGVAHNTLVTVIYSPSCINGVYVSGDESRQDLYGRQIERTASAVHKTVTSAHGNYWRWPEEEARPYVAPQQA